MVQWSSLWTPLSCPRIHRLSFHLAVGMLELYRPYNACILSSFWGFELVIHLPRPIMCSGKKCKKQNNKNKTNPTNKNPPFESQEHTKGYHFYVQFMCARVEVRSYLGIPSSVASHLTVETGSLSEHGIAFG